MKSIIAIQALRAVAAISVLTFHFNFAAVMFLGRDDLPGLHPLAAGVDLFFVISGFIMVYSSEPLFAAAGGSVTFLIRRIARIVPLYWVTTAIFILLMMPASWEGVIEPPTWETFLKSYFFIPYAGDYGLFVPFYFVAWTLNFEMFFYVTFAAVLFLPRRLAVPLLCVALCAAVALGKVLPLQFAPLRFWSDPIVLEFVFGMLIALLYRQRIFFPGWTRLCLIAAAAAVICFFAPPLSVPTGYRATLWGVPAAIIVAAATLGEQKWGKGPLTAGVKTLGDASYSICLTHTLVQIALTDLWPYGLSQLGLAGAFAIGLASTLLLSLLSYRYFEKPVTAFIRGLLERPAEALVVAPAASAAARGQQA